MRIIYVQLQQLMHVLSPKTFFSENFTLQKFLSLIEIFLIVYSEKSTQDFSFIVIILIIHLFLGYFVLDDLAQTHMLRHHTKEEILHEILTSMSIDGNKSFQIKEEKGKPMMVRITYGRVMEPSVCRILEKHLK